jgi:succinoglycan biosynthesis transport protein ExoP
MESHNEAPQSGASLLDYVQIFQRRRTIITQAFLVITTVTVLVTLLSRPVYQSSARLLVEAQSNNLNSVDASNPISELLELTAPQSVDTQEEVLQSPSLIKQVSTETGVPIEAFKVNEVEDTNVIEDTVEAGNPQLAAEAANRLLSDYIDQDVNRSLTEILSTQAFVTQRSAETQQQLSQSEANLEQFEQKYHVADIDTERTQQIQHMVSLQESLENDRAQLNAVDAQIHEDRGLFGRQQSRTVANSETTNPAISDMMVRLDDLKAQRDSMLQPGGYGPQAPSVKAIDGEIAGMQHRLALLPPLVASEAVNPNPERDTISDRLVDLQGQQAATAAQIGESTQDLANCKAAIGSYASIEVGLERLNRQHDLLTAQYEMFQDRLADLALRAKAHHATATIIESAAPVDIPVRPKRLLDIILGCILGLFVGVCLALLQEYLDDRINSVESAERMLSLPTLAQVPLVKAGEPALLTQINGFNPTAESYRILRTNINFAAIDAPIRTLVVASSGPGEGKSTTALNLSMAMAADGRKVILVDTDLRRPTIHKLLELPGIPGLTDVLLGEAKLDDVIIENKEIPNLSVITSGITPPNPSELLGSRRFRNIVDQLLQRCDLVVFDTPPTLVAADASVLASQSDGTLLVVETGGTKNASAVRTLQMLQRARANVLGVCYNKIETSRNKHHHYYYYYDSDKALSDEGTDQRRLDNFVQIGSGDHRANEDSSLGDIE